MSTTKIRPKATGTYVHVFAYCVPRVKHQEMINVMRRLREIYRKHGTIGMELYVWGQAAIFQGFAGLNDKLGVTLEDELWLEVDLHTNEPKLREFMKKLSRDKEASSYWDKLSSLVGPGRSIAMGEFDSVIL